MSVHSDEYRRYIESDEWKARRQIALDAADNTCERCGITGGLQVHHWNYVRLGDEWPSDLEALCPTCHARADSERVAARQLLEVARVYLHHVMPRDAWFAATVPIPTWINDIANRGDRAYVLEEARAAHQAYLREGLEKLPFSAGRVWYDPILDTHGFIFRESDNGTTYLVTHFAWDIPGHVLIETKRMTIPIPLVR